MINILDEILAAGARLIRQQVESFIHLETADDEQTLVSGDASLVSYIQILGAKQIIGEEEYNWIVDQSTIKLGAKFDRIGHALQLYFMRDPGAAAYTLDKHLKINRRAAESLELDMADLINERRRNLLKYLANEDIYLACWTRPNSIPPSDRKRAEAEQRENKWPKAPRAQYPYAALDPMRTRHKSFVMGVASALEELGIKCRVLEVHDALAAVRTSIYPYLRNDEWRANLPGDPITAHVPKYQNDFSDVLWPAVRHQLCVGESEIISNTIVRVGDWLWAPLDMTLAPSDPAPFPQLLQRLIDSDTPFRLSILMESGGVEGLGFKRALAAILAFTNSTNRQIKNSIETLQVLATREPVVKLRVSLATFAPRGERKLMESRLAALTQAAESWGYCQVTSATGDPLEGTMASALGVACASTAPPVVAPLREVMKIIPWQRSCSPFDEGAVLFRTHDGRLWPYQMGTTLTTTWFDLIFAQPGSGKSVLMNAMNLGTCLSAGVGNKLPYVAVLDIGPSSSGLISLLRESLPPDRRYEALHFRMRMTPEFAVNPFDTQLGCRFATADERAYLVELLTLISTPPGQEKPYDGMAQLCGFVVDEMYRWRCDTGNNTEPRPYLPRVESDVDMAIERYNIELPPEPYWWEVVDSLHDLGLHHEAMLAQRHAVPTLVDAVTASRRPQIRTLLEETQIGISFETVLHAFERMIASAVREFPVLAGVTKFDVGGARVVAVDLQDVSPQGDASADRQTSVMYMLARHILIRHWWMNPDALRQVPDKYKAYHEARLRDSRESPKRLCYDEFHRTAKTPSVRNQVVRDVREGRKWGVQIVLSSQLLADFSADMVDLATGIWICGSAVSERAITATGDTFGLSNTARNVMRYRLTGPRPSGAPVLTLHSTVDGKYEQLVINTLGPIELWALSTSAEDVALRQRLYDSVGAIRARLVLAKNFPGGTARTEIRRRVVQRVERGLMESGQLSVVIDELAEDLRTQVLKETRL